jgi:hypothetical protein
MTQVSFPNILETSSLEENKTCIICLDTSVPLLHKAKMFNCNCAIYFHEECWNLFILHRNEVRPVCPLCRKTLVENIQNNVSYIIRFVSAIYPKLIHLANMLLLAGILLSQVMYVIGLIKISPSDTYFTEAVVISVSVIVEMCLFFMFCIVCERCLPKRLENIIIYIVNFYNCFLCVYMHIAVYSHKLDNHIFIFIGTYILLLEFYAIMIIFLVIMIVQLI